VLNEGIVQAVQPRIRRGNGNLLWAHCDPVMLCLGKILRDVEATFEAIARWGRA
jgi:hypothetical protein